MRARNTFVFGNWTDPVQLESTCKWKSQSFIARTFDKICTSKKRTNSFKIIIALDLQEEEIESWSYYPLLWIMLGSVTGPL